MPWVAEENHPNHRSSNDCWKTSAEPLTSLVNSTYEGMRSRAKSVMHQFRGALTLQPTAVVHEAIIKIWGKAQRPQSRQEFMLAVSGAMRDVLIDNLRKRLSKKRGGGCRALPMDADVSRPSLALFVNKQRVHEAMDALHENFPRAASVVEMRFFGGFSMREIADELRVSLATVERDAAQGRAILYSLLSDD